jgi:serine/threonine protein phosphatase PrpC
VQLYAVAGAAICCQGVVITISIVDLHHRSNFGSSVQVVLQHPKYVVVKSTTRAMYSARYQPYPQSKRASFGFWFGSKTEVHPNKPDQENADALMTSSRFMGVFDGVGGVREVGSIPGSMSNALTLETAEEVESRIAWNAQKYDRDNQLFLKSSVSPNVAGGWLRNLVARCFADTRAVGSTVLGAAHMTNDKMDFCILGDVQILVYRAGSCSGSYVLFKSDIVRMHHDLHPQGIPPQACSYDFSDKTITYIEKVFHHCQFGSLKKMQENDTVLIVSDGVTDNLGDAVLAGLVSKAYDNQMSPQDLADAIVAESLTAAYKTGGKPDDTTATVAYLYPI